MLAWRLVVAVVLLVVLSFISFSLLALSPGDPARLLLGTRPTTPSNLAAIRAEFHLNLSFWGQYWNWLQGVAQLQFGRSIATLAPVGPTLASHLGLSFELAAVGFVFAVGGGILLGIAAAVWQERLVDRAIVALSIVGVSAPAFVAGIVLLIVFSVDLHWLPDYGKGTGGLNTLEHLLLPGLSLGLGAMALVLKVTRSSMIRELSSDYVIFARARGASTWRVLFVYALRNALIPIVTSSGLVLSYLIASAVLVEVVFNLPGIGSMLVSGVTTHDIPVVQAATLAIGAVVIVVNLLTDVLYLFIDPRVHLARGAV
jgi:peptide/nickel transport system permease protein